MTVDLTTILEKTIHSSLRKKEIRETTHRIIEKMTKILESNTTHNPNTIHNLNNPMGMTNTSNTNLNTNTSNTNLIFNDNLNKKYFTVNDSSIQELKNEYYKLKSEIGFI